MFGESCLKGDRVKVLQSVYYFVAKKKQKHNDAEKFLSTVLCSCVIYFELLRIKKLAAVIAHGNRRSKITNKISLQLSEKDGYGGE